MQACVTELAESPVGTLSGDMFNALGGLLGGLLRASWELSGPLGSSWRPLESALEALSILLETFWRHHGAHLGTLGIIFEAFRILLDPFQEPPCKYMIDLVNNDLQCDWHQHPCRCPLAYLQGRYHQSPCKSIYRGDRVFHLSL